MEKIFLLINMLVISAYAQIIVLDDNMICKGISCQQQNNKYNYGSETWGDLSGQIFTLQFFIRQNSSITTSMYVASILNFQTSLITVEQESPSIFQLRDSNNNTWKLNPQTCNNWLQLYITQQQIFIANYSYVTWYPHNIIFDQQTRINLLVESDTQYWQGYACCIMMYKGVDILTYINVDKYFTFKSYNMKQPAAIININIQEKIQSNITYDYSEYNYIVRLGDQYNFDNYDPYLIDGLLFNGSQYLIVNDIILNPQFTFEFRLQLSNSFTSNIILLNYSTYIFIFLNFSTIEYQQSGQTIQFTPIASSNIHFCIAIIQQMEESKNLLTVMFFQFSNSNIIYQKRQTITQTLPFFNGYGTLQIGSNQNQFSSDQSFLLYHFRFYTGFFIDDSSKIDPLCSIYLVDKCIICKSGYVLSDLNLCILSCQNNNYMTTFTTSHNQCIRVCHPTCATCQLSTPQICLSCYGIRNQPPQCLCPTGFYDDQVSPDCRKYIQEPTTQIGSVFINCDSVSTQNQDIIFPYSYTQGPQVSLSLSGCNQQIPAQQIDLFATQISNTQFTINVLCSFINQFYDIQWISNISNDLIVIEDTQNAPTSNPIIINLWSQPTPINEINYIVLPQILGWAQVQNSAIFRIKSSELSTRQFEITSNNQLMYLRYGIIYTTFKSYSYNQVINNSIVQIDFDDPIPKSIKLINLFQGIQSLTSLGTFNNIQKIRNQTFFQFYSQQQVNNLKGIILFVSKQCSNTTGPCDFYESAITNCNLLFSQCSCTEINYFINSSNICDSNLFINNQECDNNCKSCFGVSTYCTLCYGYQKKQLINGKCVCLLSQYLEINNICMDCHRTCQTCSNSTISDCIDCQQYAYNNNGMCICNPGYYFDDQNTLCSQCHISCQMCDGPLSNQCTACTLPRQLSISKCSCSKGYFEDQSQCKLCLYYCEDCIADQYCTLCPYSRQIDEMTNQCICSDGFYDTLQKICAECPNNCFTCNNEKKCLSCHSNQLLIDGQCQCKPDYYDEENKCLSCDTDLGLFQISCNIKKCGDGFWTPSEQCDDGNQIDRDGCTNCVIDYNYQCINEQQLKSICYKCQEQCKSCSYLNQIIKCTLCNDGYYLTQNKCIQCGYNCKACSSLSFCTQCPISGSIPDSKGICAQCKLGYYEQNGQCISQCGDGIQSVEEECDLGPQNGSGGCSNLCKQQDSFTCTDNICNINPAKNVTVDFVNSYTKTQIEIDDQDIQSNLTYCQELEVRIENFDINDFNKTLILSNNKCNLILEFKKTIKETDLIHIFIPLQQSERLIQSDVREVIITPRKYVYSTQDQIQQAGSVSSAQNQFKIALYFIGPLTALLGGFQNFMTILDILAWINNLYYLNIQFSVNVLAIFQTSIWDDIQLFPQKTFPQFNQPTDPYYTESPPHFMEKGTDPLFINNTFQSFGIIALFIIVVVASKLILIFSKKIIGRRNNDTIAASKIFQLGLQNQMSQIEKQNKRKNTNKFLLLILQKCREINTNKLSYFIKLLNLVYLDLVSAIILQLYCFQINLIKYNIILINYILTYLSILLCLILLYLSYYVTLQHQTLLNHNIFKNKYGTLYEGININNSTATLYSFINLLRKTFFLIAVVYFYNYPIFQTACCCFISFFNIGLIIYQNPFDKIKDLVCIGIPDLCIFCLMLIFTIYAIDDKIVYFSDEQRFNMGWVIIIIILISIIVQFYFLLNSVYLVLKERMLYLLNKIKQLLSK